MDGTRELAGGNRLELVDDDTPANVAELRQALRRREEQIDAVKEIGRALSSILDLDSLLALIMDKVTELMDADRSTLFMVDQANGELWSRIAQGENLSEIRLPIGKGVAGWVAETGEVAQLDDAYSDPRFNVEVDHKTGYRTKNMLVMPMRAHDGQVMGVVQVLNKSEGSFTPDDQRLLAAIMAQATVSLENSLLYQSVVSRNEQLDGLTQQLETKVEELDLLYEIEKEVSGAADVDELLRSVLRRAMAVTGTEAGAVLLDMTSDGDGDLVFRVVEGGSATDLDATVLARGRGVAGWVAEKGTPAMVNDAAADPRHDSSLDDQLHYEVRNVLAAPIHGENGAIGAIEVLNRVDGEDFDQDDLKLLTLMAGQAARAIRTAREREEKAKSGRLSAIGHALSGILHDFRTPMSIIHGYVQLLGTEEDDVLKADYARQVIKQIDTLNGMTREIMDFARGRSSVLIRKSYLHRFIAEMSELLQKEFDGHDVELAVQSRYDGIAYMDELKFKRLVINFARNAREAMPEGGRFTMVVDREDPWVIFKFSDTGSGIPQSIRQRLFDSFVTEGKEGGTGLGLAIVKKVVEEHQGEVAFETEAGTGTTFVVKIPAEHDHAAATRTVVG